MMRTLRCDHCGRVTALPEAGARSVGWRFYQGKSFTGKEISDTVCPVCSDRGPDPGPPTWDVHCVLCGWKFTDDWGTSLVPLLTAWEASTVIARHDEICEQGTTLYEVLDPDTMIWEFADEQSFRDKVEVSTPGSKRKKFL